MNAEIPRYLEAAIRAHLHKKEITLLIGPRQAGKTTLLRKIAVDLQSKGEKCLFFNLDIDTDAQFFGTQQQFVDRIAALTQGQFAYVFIDEVQRIENAGLFLKGLYDRQLPSKWIATGSGSLELKEKIAESLAGRKRSFFMSPVTIPEFLAYRLSVPIAQVGQLLHTDSHSEAKLLTEYLQYGGYPAVVTAATAKDKYTALAELFQSYVERDLQVLLQIEKSRSLVTLLQLIAHRVGQLINYQDLAALTNLSVPTVKKYLWYCQKTFVIEEVLPFFTNKEKELVKTPQYYFLDPGLQHFLTNTHTVTPASPAFGFLFQQLVLQLLKLRHADTIADIRYWRTQNQAEVDFVVYDGQHPLPVEVKSVPMAQPQIERSMRSFIADYNPPIAWIVNRSLEKVVQIDSTQVHFIPWYRLLGT
jgi:uncharacterized protein